MATGGQLAAACARVEADSAPRVRFWRLPWFFDAKTLQAELSRIEPNLWHTHFNTGYHDGGWSGLALVSADGEAARLYADPNHVGPGVETALLARCPAMRSVLQSLPFTIQSARLLRLAAGSHIREHRDYGIGLDEGSVRLHVPVATSAGAELYLDGVRVPMAEGECWYLDFGLPHRVQNRGAEDRVHLVIDCAVDDRLRAMLPAPETGERQLQALLLRNPPSSQERFERFRAEVLRRPELLEALRGIDDEGGFVARAVSLGSQCGTSFAEEDVRSAMQARRRAWIERHAFATVPRRAGHAAPAALSSAAGLRLQGWAPALAEVTGERLVAELCHVGDQRFTRPFYEETLAACMRRPVNVLFRHRLDDLAMAHWLESSPGLAPTGFVFHMSRCGSTLLGRVLAASPHHRVMSEPGPLDAALRAGDLPAADPRRMEWLRVMIGMLGQPASADEQRFFIKFDSWHANMLSLVRRTYPDVPWVFLVRDPVEVIVSHLRMPGAQMVPGMSGFMPPGVEPESAATMARPEYCARVLGAICDAALEEIERDPRLALVVDYQDLVGALSGSILKHLGLPWIEAERGPIADVLRYDAKNPSLEFSRDTESKRCEASDDVRAAAERWVAPGYRGLLDLARRADRSAGGSNRPLLIR